MLTDSPLDTFGASGDVEFVGLRFAKAKAGELLDMIGTRSAGDPFEYVVTPNVDHVVRLASGQHGSEFHAAYEGAAVRVCDSRVLAGLARLFGTKLSVVPGSDLTAQLLARVIGSGRRIAVIGSDAEAIELLRTRYPGVQILHHEPPMGLLRKPEAMAAAAAFAAGTRSDFVLIAVGSPQQEILARAVRERGDAVGTGLCIGASVDFLTGRMRRAPRFVQKMGFEWAFRLLSQPRRLWRRYLVDGPRIVGIMFIWRFGGRSSGA